MIKKATIAGFLAAMFINASAFASPSCVLMKFTDDTRFEKIESAATLSDMVMERLLKSGKFNFKETKVIDRDIEKLLYEERREEFQNARAAMEEENYDRLFNGPGFDRNRAQSIASAGVGQVVSPDIVRKIGEEHGAEYLIQGTIIGIGIGVVTAADKNSDILVNVLSNLILGNHKGLSGTSDTNDFSLAVQTDLRIIKASTGNVVWASRVMAEKTKTEKEDYQGASVEGKFNSDDYYKLLKKSADKIADKLIDDLEKGKLFL